MEIINSSANFQSIVDRLSTVLPAPNLWLANDISLRKAEGAFEHNWNTAARIAALSEMFEYIKDEGEKSSALEEFFDSHGIPLETRGEMVKLWLGNIVYESNFGLCFIVEAGRNEPKDLHALHQLLLIRREKVVKDCIDGKLLDFSVIPGPDGKPVRGMVDKSNSEIYSTQAQVEAALTSGELVSLDESILKNDGDYPIVRPEFQATLQQLLSEVHGRLLLENTYSQDDIKSKLGNWLVYVSALRPDWKQLLLVYLGYPAAKLSAHEFGMAVDFGIYDLDDNDPFPAKQWIIEHIQERGKWAELQSLRRSGENLTIAALVAEGIIDEHHPIAVFNQVLSQRPGLVSNDISNRYHSVQNGEVVKLAVSLHVHSARTAELIREIVTSA